MPGASHDAPGTMEWEINYLIHSRLTDAVRPENVRQDDRDAVPAVGFADLMRTFKLDRLWVERRRVLE
jgi:hypothetical protein